MICLIALIVFSILGIFSVKYRELAKEAFDCVFRRVTLRPCQSGLDRRIKGKLTGKLMKTNRSIGRFVYKNFEAISWFFTILMILSLGYTILGAYNFILYGNCNGPQSSEFCIYSGLIGNSSHSNNSAPALCTLPVENQTN